MGMTGATGTGGMSILNMLNTHASAAATTTATTTEQSSLSTSGGLGSGLGSGLGLGLDGTEEASRQGLGQEPSPSFGQSLLSMLNTSSSFSLNPSVGAASALNLNNQDPSFHDTSAHRLSVSAGVHTPIQRPSSTASVSGTPVVTSMDGREMVASGWPHPSPPLSSISSSSLPLSSLSSSLLPYLFSYLSPLLPSSPLTHFLKTSYDKPTHNLLPHTHSPPHSPPPLLLSSSF